MATSRKSENQHSRATRHTEPSHAGAAIAAPEGAAFALQLGGVIGGLFVGVLAAPDIQFGFSSHDQLPTVALWLAAGASALGLTIDKATIPRRWALNPLILGLVGLIAVAVLLAPFAPYPLLSFAGSPQSGEGALRHLATLVLVVASWRLLCAPHVRAALLGAATLAAIAVAVISRIDFGSGRIFVFTEYLAYPALALGAIGVAELGRARAGEGSAPRLLVFAAIAVAFAVLALSTNRSAWLGAAAGGACMAAWAGARRARLGRRLFSRPALAGALALIPWIILAIIATVGFDLLPVESIRARARILAVLSDAISDRPSILAVGGGWGSTRELFSFHLTQAPAALWSGAWDMVERDMFHSHHDGMEALLALGVTGAVLWTIVLVAPVVMAAEFLLPAAILFTASLAVTDATWFQLAQSTGALALAAAWVTDPGDMTPPSAGSELWRRIAAGSAAAILIAGVGAVGAWERQFAQAREAFLRAPPECAAVPVDTWRGGVEFSYFFVDTMQKRLPRLAAAGPAGEADARLLESLFCEADRHAAEGRAGYLMMVGLVFRGEIAFAPGAPTQLREDVSRDWERRMRAFLAIAPHRTDLAITMMTTWLVDRRFGDVRRFADELRAMWPDDPVALYYSGVARVGAPNSLKDKEDGIALLRLAMLQGIERLMPIDDATKAAIRNAG